MTTHIERRALQQERAKVHLEKREDGEAHITGYAAVYFDAANPEGTQYELWEDTFERIMPGAFDRAIREDDVRCLFNHESSQLLGRTKSGTCQISADNVGLRYDCRQPDTTCGRDVSESLSRGDVDGSSFGFRATETTWHEVDGKTYREILAVELYDVGPVTFPAYQGTTSDVARRSLDAWQQDVRQRSDRTRRLRALKLRHTP